MLKVLLCGEGNNELGSRWHDPPGDDPGVIETLLRRVRPQGWRVLAAQDWKSIRKYRAGAARTGAAHEDARNVLGIALQAYEQACELLVFVRDRDGDDQREPALAAALSQLPGLGWAEDYRYALTIVGAIDRPTLDAWIVCLHRGGHTDELSPTQVNQALAAAGISRKSTADYVAAAQRGSLPTGTGSLADWLARAHAAFRQLLDGQP